MLRAHVLATLPINVSHTIYLHLPPSMHDTWTGIVCFKQKQHPFLKCMTNLTVGPTGNDSVNTLFKNEVLW